MNIWKFGCNWGAGKPYFDNFIKNEQIVLCWEHNFTIGDLILIAKGHDIIAIAKVVSAKKPVTTVPEYESQFKQNSIDYIDIVYFCKVDWIDLKEQDYFKYQLQQGICNVKKSEIQNTAISLFEKYNFNNKFKNNQLFRIKDISEWQIHSNKSKVKLPTLQRGFVWKPKQVEDLWDSLLRGFPVGSFLLADDASGNYFLMDGQQRATSIFLGFHNPWVDIETKAWSLKHIPTLWMDIDPEPNQITETHKYVFRLLTQSHPWGYQRKNNNITLSIPDRNKALEIFENNEILKNKGYTSYPTKLIFPFDSDLPVPVSFLLNAFSINDITFDVWKGNLLKFCEEHIPQNIFTKGAKFNNKNSYIQILSESNRLDEIYKIFKRLYEVQIHSNIIKKEILTENENDNAENPTLFVRLNSSGTSLNGDELIYSIYKAYFPETKSLIENIGLSFISAPVIISMVSRIAQAEISNNFVKKFDVRSFQNQIKNIEFKNKLSSLINNDIESGIKVAFNRAVEILRDKSLSIPDVLVKDLVKKNQELFLLLVFWLHKHPTIKISDNQRVVIIAKFTLLSWFGLNTPEYVKQLWIEAKNEDLWLKKFTKVQLEKFIACIIPPKILYTYYLNHHVIKAGSRSLLFEKDINETYKVLEIEEIINIMKDGHNVIEEQSILEKWNNFFNRLFWNRSLIVFAQRKYINENFKDFNQIEDLQDTNVPWDWDHIYPDSWVYYQQTNEIIRRWNNCIGNFRALSLGVNRSQKNYISPKDRFESKEERQNSFILDNDFELWNKIDNRIYSTEKVEVHTKAIIYRTLNMYNEWWNQLRISEVLCSV